MNQLFVAAQNLWTDGDIPTSGNCAYGTNNPNFAVTGMSQMPAMSPPAMAAGDLPVSYIGSLNLTPLNATTPQTILASDVFNAQLGIAQRRNTLNNNRFTKQIAINNLTTIAAVVAYNATTGWSF
jgi:hypothetical protein